jgi:hypothetical protein
MANRKSLKDNEVPDDEVVAVIDPKVYNEIARCAKLLAVQLVESSFTISPVFFDPEVDGRHGVDFTDIHASFDEESRVTTSIFHFETYVKKGKKKAFCMKDKYVVFYRVSDGCDSTHALAFSRKTGLIACYPYFRAHVAATASMANAEIPILPTIASMPVREKIKKESQ